MHSEYKECASPAVVCHWNIGPDWSRDRERKRKGRRTKTTTAQLIKAPVTHICISFIAMIVYKLPPAGQWVTATELAWKQRPPFFRWDGIGSAISVFYSRINLDYFINNWRGKRVLRMENASLAVGGRWRVFSSRPIRLSLKSSFDRDDHLTDRFINDLQSQWAILMCSWFSQLENMYWLYLVTQLLQLFNISNCSCHWNWINTVIIYLAF